MKLRQNNREGDGKLMHRTGYSRLGRKTQLQPWKNCICCWRRSLWLPLNKSLVDSICKR